MCLSPTREKIIVTLSRSRRLAASLLAGGVALALAAGAASPATAAPGEDPLPLPVMTPELQQDIQTIVDGFPAASGAPGVSVAVVTPDPATDAPVVTTFTAGTTVPQDPGSTLDAPPIEETTQFELGSETKVFTADLLTALVSDGVVGLDDPVQKYAPEGVRVPVFTGVDGVAVPLTLRHLATHTAALPDLPPNFGEGCQGDPTCENPRPGYTRTFLWQAVQDQTLAWEPGTRWFYSNFGFALLGAILSDVVESPTSPDEPPAFQDALDLVFLDALGMGSTQLEPADPNERFAYPIDAKGERSWLWDNVNAFAGGGGLVSTAQDMGRWVSAHLGYEEESASPGVREMPRTLEEQIPVDVVCAEYDLASCTDADFAMGLGWQLYPAGYGGVGAAWAYKNGGTNGSSSDTALAVTERVGVTTMWNRARGKSDIRELAAPLLTLILASAQPPIDEPEPEPEPTAPEPQPTTSPVPTPTATAPVTPAPSASPSTTPGAPTTPRKLATTGFGGSDPLVPTLVAVGLLAGGAALIFRRRRHAR